MLLLHLQELPTAKFDWDTKLWLISITHYMGTLLALNQIALDFELEVDPIPDTVLALLKSTAPGKNCSRDKFDYEAESVSRLDLVIEQLPESLKENLFDF